MTDHNRPAHAGYFAGSLLAESIMSQPEIVAILQAAIRLYPEGTQREAITRGFQRAIYDARASQETALAIIGNLQGESAA